MNQQWIVIVGNPIDGFTFYGPFPSSDVAVDWADSVESFDDVWHVSELLEP